jgi:hypothetical protein
LKRWRGMFPCFIGAGRGQRLIHRFVRHQFVRRIAGCVGIAVRLRKCQPFDIAQGF